MKKIRISIYYSILLMFCQAFLGSTAVFAEVDNFKFKDFTADYYLSRDTEGVSRLRVVENLTAEFPDFQQNKGICRDIPFTNQDGANVTLSSLGRGDIELKRNGLPEPIYSIEKFRNFYEVCTGDEDYVLGEQVYTFEYEFSKVVTDFSSYQELYWDTNGNGWEQEFGSLTARVYIDAAISDDLTGEAWCYVGRYGESGQEKCEITRTEDGFVFVTGPLKQHENLTFDIEFLPGTFVVPEPEQNYILVWALGGILVICIWLIVYVVKKWQKVREKEDYFKGYFVKPEYQPSEEYDLAELVELYMGKKKDVKVALLLDLIVQKKISLIKGEKKEWSFEVKSLDGVGTIRRNLLAILNGGTCPQVGEVVPIKKRFATSGLVKLGQDFEKEILQKLKQGGLVEKNYIIGESGRSSTIASLFLNLIVMWPMLTFMVSGGILVFVEENMSGEIVMNREFTFLVGAVLFVIILIWTIFNNRTNRFKNITKRGIEAEKYMEGLELYIRMAEKERLEFLQSVKGAEVSPGGVVKLYEKLLPYAAVFGLEKSWMEEMEKYCEVEGVSEPDYLVSGIAISEISRMMTRTVEVVNSSTRMISSGGGSSSGFSGGGGGGFSGGGGGGGGGGGR